MLLRFASGNPALFSLFYSAITLLQRMMPTLMYERFERARVFSIALPEKTFKKCLCWHRLLLRPVLSTGFVLYITHLALLVLNHENLQEYSHAHRKKHIIYKIKQVPNLTGHIVKAFSRICSHCCLHLFGFSGNGIWDRPSFTLYDRGNEGSEFLAGSCIGG